MTLKFDRILEAIEVRVHAKFHQAVHVARQKKNNDDAKNNTAVASSSSKMCQ